MMPIESRSLIPTISQTHIGGDCQEEDDCSLCNRDGSVSFEAAVSYCLGKPQKILYISRANDA